MLTRETELFFGSLLLTAVEEDGGIISLLLSWCKSVKLATGEGAMVEENGCLAGSVRGDEAIVGEIDCECKKPLATSDFFQKVVGLGTGGALVVLVTLLLL